MSSSDWDSSHKPSEPRNSGFSTGVISCLNCGAILRTSQGPSAGRRVNSACAPDPSYVPPSFT